MTSSHAGAAKLIRQEFMRKPTIYEALAAKLGREPSNAELKADVVRILNEGLQECAAKGKLKHQRGRI